MSAPNHQSLARLFEDVAAGAGLVPPVDRDTIEEVHAELAAQLGDLARHIPHGAAPLVLTKDRVRNVLACETGALASDRSRATMNTALMLGTLVDRVAAAYAVTGVLPADPFAFALESLRAERDQRCLAWLDSSSADEVGQLTDDLTHRTAQMAASWPTIDGTWFPRPEDRATIGFAESRVRLSGRFDLVVGGPPSQRERVIVEIKAGGATGVHQPDLYWYGLLAALRDRVAPRIVAVWSAADDITVTAPISAGALESAARRVVAAATQWIEILHVRPPTLHAHQGCRWCPSLETCPTGQAWTPDD